LESRKFRIRGPLPLKGRLSRELWNRNNIPLEKIDFPRVSAGYGLNSKDGLSQRIRNFLDSKIRFRSGSHPLNEHGQCRDHHVHGDKSRDSPVNTVALPLSCGHFRAARRSLARKDRNSSPQVVQVDHERIPRTIQRVTPHGI